MTPEEKAKEIVNAVEALCWADNWTVHKAIPMVAQALKEYGDECLERARQVCASKAEHLSESGSAAYSVAIYAECAEAIEAIKSGGGE